VKKQEHSGRLLRTLAAAAIPVAVWGAAENTLLLRVQEYRVPLAGLPRTAVIADLHKRRFGRHNCRLIQTVAAQHPELIVITGDLVSRTVSDLTETAHLMHALRQIAPVLAVTGNHEADLPPTLFLQFRQTAQDCGITLLENETVRIGAWQFAGLHLSPDYYRGGGMFGFKGKRICTANTLTRHLGKCSPHTVLLAHNPLSFPAYAEWGAALTLSGHVHGGAVRLPYVGGLLSPERTFFPRYDKGMFRIGTHRMIVSGGLGKLRLFNPPEILIIQSVCL